MYQKKFLGHGVGHMQWNFLSQRAYIAMDDGGYISTFDVEDVDHDDYNNSHVLGGADTSTYRTIIVQQVLNAQICQPNNFHRRHNLFQNLFIINNYRTCVTII
jgi:hypothetical protein